MFIEDVFSTYLYTGTGAAQTITNGIDLSGNGGLVWAKTRDYVSSHALFDTVRGGSSILQPNLANAEYTGSTYINPFNSNGFTWATGDNQINGAGRNYVSWTFREQPKFFDIVTWSGNDASNRQIAHNLGSVPGCIIVKTTNNASDWSVYHRSLGATKGLYLNLTQAEETNTQWGNTTPTSSVFTTNLNGAGNNYVAYLFAHDAGGFGLTGTDNVISCGSFTATGNDTINLGFEPQWLLMKRVSTTGNWSIDDTMRGFSLTGDRFLNPNLSAAESAGGGDFPTATGFEGRNYGSGTVIYIAIRRGPMKVPTLGTSVFAPATYTGNGSTGQTFTNTVNNGGSLVVIKGKNDTFPPAWYDQLRGVGDALVSSSVGGEQQAGAGYEVNAFTNTGFSLGGNYNLDVNNTGAPFVYWQFVRAPGFFDEVCYTGTGSATTFSHNLGAVPELMIVKERNGANGWQVYSASLTNTQYLILNTAAGVPASSATRWNSTTPTSTVFSVGTHGATNGSGQNFVNYLFATCAGVSKVGSYTGTGTTQTINCGFTTGARFVLIKRTDSTGDWYVWDSARGIIPLNDPYLLLNSNAAEVTGTDYVDTTNVGFDITSTAPAAINANGGTFIFLAIA
jgi:hypothetical protein